MKSPFLILFSFILIFSSCITIETTSSGFKDEIYYTSDNYAEVAEQEATEIRIEEEVAEEEYSEEENYVDEYASDDYYDYQYSSRIRRFHGPSFGFGYYNNYFTNSFWYSSNPLHCGVSIYYGYNFWDPFYYDPFYHSYAYSPFYYQPFYHHHHHGYYGHHGYHGHHGGLLAYAPTYYNSYDNNSIYYGPRENNKNKTPERFASLYREEVKNRKPQATYSKGNFENDKKPNYNVQQTTEFGSRRPTSNKINNSINSNSKVNNSFSKPVFNQSVNTNKKPQNIKPTYSKPSYNKPVYSKPSKTKKPFEDNSIKTPSSNKTYSKPTFNSSPRSSSPRGGSSGRRPR